MSKWAREVDRPMVAPGAKVGFKDADETVEEILQDAGGLAHLLAYAGGVVPTPPAQRAPRDPVAPSGRGPALPTRTEATERWGVPLQNLLRK
eukprot:7948963-Alexandrium_andersonii.AAC.1